MKFEYLVFGSKFPMASELDPLGARGWELVHVDRDGYNWTFLFKRQI